MAWGEMHLVCGKSGSGKSLLMLRAIVKELVFGKRTVVTNLPVLMDGLSIFLAKTYPDVVVDLLNRVRLIDGSPEVASEFWRYRGAILDEQTGEFQGWLTLPPCNEDTGAVDVRALYPVKDGNGNIPPSEMDRLWRNRCFYVIDEAYNYYNSRYWQKSGRRVIWYCGQQRKFRDETYLGTHHHKDLDKQMLPRFQDFYYLENHAKKNVAGVFRSFPWMSWRKYAEPEVRGITVMARGKFGVDPDGYCSCYATDAGVGIESGLGGDVGQKAKGLPLWVAGVGLLLLIPAVAGMLPLIARTGVGALVQAPPSALPKASKAASASAPQSGGGLLGSPLPGLLSSVLAPVNVPPGDAVMGEYRGSASSAVVDPGRGSGPGRGPRRAEGSNPSAVSAPGESSDDPKVTGLMRGGGIASVYLSDGSVEAFPTDAVVETSRGVSVDSGGQVTRWKWARLNPASSRQSPRVGHSVASPVVVPDFADSVPPGGE